ncbi:glycosyltransferase family 2 protein [Robiginitalea biformata]|uniref:Putative glycosyltransferase n=1 Tax=Robiginitalea biformata (strain ATCC BAA-864 / DSM 15991 / KCTC 12146 / HTCC2501) TaxID=313596 RepID=A4CP29_ROBBH|nr:glycosyltransferase family 2 protein [Robiginitalea biformata]EAR14646.1 putative glycosyltransferase [Robiginitalea biformata HTCC2501]
MKVSIVIPAHNSEKFIDRCLSSVSSQSYGNIEIIVVNDGSTDGTLPLIKAWQQKDARILLMDQENAGTLMARKIGIQHATGDAILNLDSDDYLEKHAVELLVHKMEETSADIVVANHFMLKNGHKKLIKNALPRTQDKRSLFEYLLTGKLTGYIWGRLFRVDLLKTLEMPAYFAFSEDVIANFSLIANNDLKIALIEEGILNYVIHTSNVSQSEISRPVEGFYREHRYIETILAREGLQTELEKELAIYKSKSWVVYCRKGGELSKDPQYHRAFFDKNYPLVKDSLPLYQRIEMLAYAKNLRFGRMVTLTLRRGYKILETLKKAFQFKMLIGLL